MTEPFQRTWDDGFAAIICPITPEFCDKHAPSYGEHKCWHRTEARECSGSWESDCECIDACYVCSEGEVLRNKESIVCKRYGQVDEPRHPVDKVPDAAGGEPACPPEFEERSLMDGRSYCFEMCVEGMLESVWKPTCFKVNSSHFWALEQPAERLDCPSGGDHGSMMGMCGCSGEAQELCDMSDASHYSCACFTCPSQLVAQKKKDDLSSVVCVVREWPTYSMDELCAGGVFKFWNAKEGRECGSGHEEDCDGTCFLCPGAHSEQSTRLEMSSMVTCHVTSEEEPNIAAAAGIELANKTLCTGDSGHGDATMAEAMCGCTGATGSHWDPGNGRVVCLNGECACYKCPEGFDEPSRDWGHESWDYAMHEPLMCYKYDCYSLGMEERHVDGKRMCIGCLSGPDITHHYLHERMWPTCLSPSAPTYSSRYKTPTKFSNCSNADAYDDHECGCEEGFTAMCELGSCACYTCRGACQHGSPAPSWTEIRLPGPWSYDDRTSKWRFMCQCDCPFINDERLGSKEDFDGCYQCDPGQYMEDKTSVKCMVTRTSDLERHGKAKHAPIESECPGGLTSVFKPEDCGCGMEFGEVRCLGETCACYKCPPDSGLFEGKNGLQCESHDCPPSYELHDEGCYECSEGRLETKQKPMCLIEQRPADEKIEFAIAAPCPMGATATDTGTCGCENPVRICYPTVCEVRD